MRPHIRLVLALLLAVSAPQSLLSAYHEPYSGSRIFWDNATRRTVFDGGGYARIIQLQDNRLMAVCESGGIKIAFSSNRGSSWSTPTRIVSNVNDTPNCVPDLIQLSDGTIIVAYNPRPKEPYTEDRRFGIRCKRSTDNGRTWSQEIFVNDASYTFQDGCWEPSLLELPTGELQLYFADEGPFTSSGEQQISLCRSFDGGQTWGEAERVCFRSGFRDGMPVPVLLNDQTTIVVAIEDNGWGYNDFMPTTVRTTLTDNWQTWVNAGSKSRDLSPNLDFCPVATGGAPYLRVLPWGETVMSHQSPYDNDGKIQMRVMVGNDQARDFKAVSLPFGEGGVNPQGMWNSLAVIDTGTVIAVSGINGKIEMIKGYPVRLLQAPFAHPDINGRISRTEGYFNASAQQIILGTQTGTRCNADFAYDLDSLYFVARVMDKTRELDATTPDALALMIDVDGASNSRIQKECYRLIIKPDGSCQLQQGSGSWKAVDGAATIHVAAISNATNYTLEVAIPWATLGKDAAPIGQRMAAALTVTDNQSGTILTETIPDAHDLKPWTWMELRLQDLPTGIQAPRAAAPKAASRPNLQATATYDLLGRRLSSAPPHTLLIRGGAKYYSKINRN